MISMLSLIDLHMFRIYINCQKNLKMYVCRSHTQNVIKKDPETIGKSMDIFVLKRSSMNIDHTYLPGHFLNSNPLFQLRKAAQRTGNSQTNKQTNSQAHSHLAQRQSSRHPIEYFDNKLDIVQYQDIRCHQVTSYVI